MDTPNVINETITEPLFRGINKETNEWVYGFGWYKSIKGDAVLFTENDIVFCLPDTMGQFTGLCDKNGKKAFDGDLFYWHGALRRVVYRNDKGAFMAKRLGSWQKSYFYLTDLKDRFEIVGDTFNDNLPAEIHW